MATAVFSMAIAIEAQVPVAVMPVPLNVRDPAMGARHGQR